MRDYGQYCPVALGSEVLADRWTPLILREMVLGSTRFNDIERGLPGISRSLLLQRLRHLERKGVVAIVPVAGGRGNEYHLTPAGKDLEPVIMALGEWTVRWLFSRSAAARRRPGHADVVDAPPGRRGARCRPAASSSSSTTTTTSARRSGWCSTAASRRCA